MIFSDLPTPAEASVHTAGLCPGLRAGGKPVSTRIKSGAGLFRDHALAEAALIAARRLSGDLAERGSERARLAEAEGEPDLGDRVPARGQHDLGLLDAASGVIAMRWHAERLLEGAAEIIGGEPGETGKRRERDLLEQMLLDIRGHDPLLPRGEPAAELG